ncbi:MAG: hypothetical protein IKV80_01945, partial [Bacteroidales bacterium]|nr:hypothetical protein [Bacteroidales bacterium]
MEDNKNKRDEGLVGGIILIAIGIIALLVTFFDVDIVWSELAKFWPVFIIIFGVSLLPLNKVLKSVSVIVIILISCLIYCNEVNGNENTSDEMTSEVLLEEGIETQEFFAPFKDNITEASVEINYGAGVLYLNSPVAELVKARNMSDKISQNFYLEYEGSHAEILFDVEDDNYQVNNVDEVKSNRFDISLNEAPIYDFELNLGACEMNFDFSEYKVSDIEINSGASNIDIKLGELFDSTRIVISTGVSKIRIGIPSNSGCRVECESVLSLKDFDGFVKKSSNVYETSNYSSAENNIEIEFEGA